MKYSVVLVAAFAAIAAAQSELSACGQTCISNMLALAPSLGCPSGDAVCLCRNVNFSYGIHDCAYQACSPDDAATIVAYGVKYCENAGTSSNHTGSVATETISPTKILTASDTTGAMSILPVSTHISAAVSATTHLSGPSSSAAAPTAGSPTISAKESTTAALPTTSVAGGAKQTAAAGLMAIAGLAALVL